MVNIHYIKQSKPGAAVNACSEYDCLNLLFSLDEKWSFLPNYWNWLQVLTKKKKKKNTVIYRTMAWLHPSAMTWWAGLLPLACIQNMMTLSQAWWEAVPPSWSLKLTMHSSLKGTVIYSTRAWLHLQSSNLLILVGRISQVPQHRVAAAH